MDKKVCICIMCQKEFPSRGGGDLFCSDECFNDQL